MKDCVLLHTCLNGISCGGGSGGNDGDGGCGCSSGCGSGCGGGSGDGGLVFCSLSVVKMVVMMVILWF